MLPAPRADLVANTFDYEMAPLVKPTGFREYDARWLFGPEINLLGVQALGLGLGTLIHEMGQKRIVVGHDFRSYSLSIKQAEPEKGTPRPAVKEKPKDAASEKSGWEKAGFRVRK